MTDLKKQTPNLDDLLADFTDRVLDEKNTIAASSTEEELRGLEETILHLQRTLPQEAPDKAMQKRMLADFRSRTRSVERSSRSSWQSRQSRQRWSLAFIAIAVVAAIFFVTSLSLVDGGNIQATAGLQPQSVILLLIAGGCIIALFIWLKRRQ